MRPVVAGGKRDGGVELGARSGAASLGLMDQTQIGREPVVLFRFGGMPQFLMGLAQIHVQRGVEIADSLIPHGLRAGQRLLVPAEPRFRAILAASDIVGGDALLIVVRCDLPGSAIEGACVLLAMLKLGTGALHAERNDPVVDVQCGVPPRPPAWGAQECAPGRCRRSR
jgi:hypothetical protein